MESRAQKLMTVEDFLDWTQSQPESLRYELVDGIPRAMAPERIVHARIKFNIAKSLDRAITKEALPCEVLVDGVGVQVGAETSYQPDVLLHCNKEPLDGEARYINEPILLVEVLSPSTASFDCDTKLIDYFKLSSLQHYLIIDPVKRVIIHHQKQEDAKILTALVYEGEIALNPPKIVLAVNDVFPAQG